MKARSAASSSGPCSPGCRRVWSRTSRQAPSGRSSWASRCPCRARGGDQVRHSRGAALMFLPERYRRNPPIRRPVAPERPIDADADTERNAWDEADELASMPDDDFYRQLRQDVDRVAAGEVPGGRENVHPVTKPRRVRRDKRGGPSSRGKSLTPVAKIRHAQAQAFTKQNVRLPFPIGK